jgi:Protein of unknown function (DUF3352)
MNDQPNTGGSTGEGVPAEPETRVWSPTPPAIPPAAPAQQASPFDPAPEPATPPIEPADDAIFAPASSVSRDTHTFGSQPASGRRGSGIRWAIALIGVVIVVGVTAAILALATNRSPASIAVGYMPADTISYAEYRLDLPGDQRTKLASALSKFPAFADQAAIQPKLYDIFDRIIRAATHDKQSFTADIDPWFSGQIAMGSGPMTAPEPNLGFSGSPLGPDSLIVITIKDQAKATEWLKKTFPQPPTETQYNGTTIYSTSAGGTGSFVFAITDKVLLAGADATVRAAIDSKGGGKLADDAEFKAALATATKDYVAFAYTEYRAYLQSVLDATGGQSMKSTTVDDELLLLVPAWEGGYLRFEDDSLVGQASFPSVDVGFEAKNKRSSLINHVPASTLFFAESHDIGTALTALIDKFRNLPDLRDSFAQVEQAAGVVGGFSGILGWWGDMSVVVSKTPDGSVGGGLLIAPTDAAKAKTTFDTLRSFVVLAGKSAGVELRDVQHAGATVTILDFSGAAGAASGFPPGVKPELAYAVRDDIVVIGYGESFVDSVLDAGPGSSLADSARFKDLLKRVGEDNIGFAFIDISAIRELVEPLAHQAMSPDEWAIYEREVLPYVEHLDAVISSAVVDGGVDHLVQAVTRK